MLWVNIETTESSVLFRNDFQIFCCLPRSSLYIPLACCLSKFSSETQIKQVLWNGWYMDVELLAQQENWWGRREVREVGGEGVGDTARRHWCILAHSLLQHRGNNVRRCVLPSKRSLEETQEQLRTEAETQTETQVTKPEAQRFYPVQRHSTH